MQTNREPPLSRRRSVPPPPTASGAHRTNCLSLCRFGINPFLNSPKRCRPRPPTDHSPFPGPTNEPRIRPATFSESHKESTRRSSSSPVFHPLHSRVGACGARGRRRGSLSFGFEALSISLRSILGGDDNLLQSRPPTAPLGPSPTPPYPSKNPPPTPKRTRIHYLPPASLPRLTRKLPRHAAPGGLTRVQGLALILTACSVNAPRHRQKGSSLGTAPSSVIAPGMQTMYRTPRTTRSFLCDGSSRDSGRTRGGDRLSGLRGGVLASNLFQIPWLLHTKVMQQGFKHLPSPSGIFSSIHEHSVA